MNKSEIIVKMENIVIIVTVDSLDYSQGKAHDFHLINKIKTKVSEKSKSQSCNCFEKVMEN